MSALLAAEAAAFHVGDKALVADVSVAIEPGRVLVVIGPNGAGKSTLVRLLSGEAKPSAGRILYGGLEVGAIEPWRLACLRAVLPQSTRLAFPFNAGEIVRIGIDGMGRGIDAADREAIFQAALGRADIHHLAARSYQSLSGGEQQRTQFARVLAQLAAGRSVADRQVLLLDEPIASLDLKHQLSLLEAARALAREGVGVLAVLHDLNLAATFADEILVMSRGRAVAQGTPAAVLTDRMIAEVFEVDLRIGRVPTDRPFLLPDRIASPG